MCGIEQALPYIALAVLCPAAYEGMARAKISELLGASSAVVRPHGENRKTTDDPESEAER